MEMVVPVLISLSTTAVAFSLFMFLADSHRENTSGRWLLSSSRSCFIAVLESFFFLPAHLAHSKALREDNQPTRFELWFNNAVDWINERVYQPVFRFFVTKWSLMPYVTLVVFISLLIGAFSIMGAGLVNFTFFPNLDDKAVFIELNMPPGTPVEVTTAKLETIRQAAARANTTTKEQYGKEKGAHQVRRSPDRPPAQRGEAPRHLRQQ